MKNKQMIHLLLSFLVIVGIGLSTSDSSEAASMKSDVGLTLKEGTSPSSSTEPSSTTETTTSYSRTSGSTWSYESGSTWPYDSGENWLQSKPIGRLPMTGEQLVGASAGLGAILVLLALWLMKRRKRKDVNR